MILHMFNKEDKGKIEKCKFNGGYQAEVWFKPNVLTPGKKLDESFVLYMDPDRDYPHQPSKKTFKVWSTYVTLRKTITAQLPTKEQTELFVGPVRSSTSLRSDAAILLSMFTYIHIFTFTMHLK